MRFLLKKVFPTRILNTLVFWYFRFFYNPSSKSKDRVIWGVSAIINIKYWSDAATHCGFKSETLILQPPSHIFNSNLFNKSLDDVVPPFLNADFWHLLMTWREIYTLKCLFAVGYVMKFANLFHFDYDGGILKNTSFEFDEYKLYKRTGVKTICSAYGSDIYQYSQIRDLTIRHALIASYPLNGKNEQKINERVKHYNLTVDFILAGFIQDGRGYYDLLFCNPLCINLSDWQTKLEYSKANGKETAVKIVHLSNHKYYTGSKQIIATIEELIAEGYNIDFFYPENRVTNSEVRQILYECDIFIDGLYFNGYGMAALEAMATGVCSIVNLDSKDLIQIFRRFSYLNECPLVSSSPEKLKETLIPLILNPELRMNLGTACRKYVEKYHGFRAFKFWFSNAYSALVNNEEKDFHSFFNPNDNSSYNNQSPKIEHPLIENKIPEALF